MKKLTLVLIGITLTLSSIGQAPMNIAKATQVINGDTTEYQPEFKNVGIYHPAQLDKMKLFFNNTGTKDGLKVKYDIIKLEKDASGEESTYTLINKAGEIVKLTHNFLAFTGVLYLDQDKDGNFQKILVLN